MKRLFRAAASALVCLAVLLLPALLPAQTVSTNVTLSSVLLGAVGTTGTPMPYGSVCAVAVNGGIPVTFSATGWGLVPAGKKFCGRVVAGAIAGGFNLPDSAHTNFPNALAYNITIQQTDSNGNPIGPATILPAVTGVTGTTYALDAYAPPAIAPVPSAALLYAASVPASCTTPSILTTASGAYRCAGGVYVAIGGGGGGSGTLTTFSFTGTSVAPLFTCNVANATTTPALTCTLASAAAHTVFGNFTGASAAPTFSAAPVFSAANLTNFPTFNQSTTGNAATASALAALPTVCNTGQVPTGILANGNATGCAAVSSGSVAVGQVAGLNSLVPSVSAMNPLQDVANHTADQLRFEFVDGGGNHTGTYGYKAGSAYAMWVMDFTLAVLQNPARFSTADIQNAVTRFSATANAHGQTALSINTDGTVGNFTSGNAPNAIYGPADSWATLPILCYVLYQRTGSTACYSSILSTYKAGSTYGPRGASTHVPTVTAGTNEYVAAFAFQEVPRHTGDVANAAVWLGAADEVMLQMATATGDSTNVSYFTTELGNVRTALAGEFTDATTHALIAATGHNSGNIDLESTALACFWNAVVPGSNLLSATQCGQISDYFHTNLSAFTHNGYILNSPTSWAFIGVTSDGSGTYSAQPSGYGVNQYQDHSYWSVHSGWFGYTLALKHFDDIPGFLASARDSAGLHNPAIEWINNDFTAAHASVLNLESPAGFSWLAANVTGPTPLAAGAACINQDGALENGTCGGVGVVYGTPSISGAGASFASSAPPNGWPLNDHIFTVVLSPTGTIGPSTVFATVTFGKTWVDASGNPTYENCTVTAVLPPAAGVAIYAIDSGFPAAGKTLTIGTGASQSITPGPTYAWAVNCSGTTEQ